MTMPTKREKGQALPMVTLSLIAMCGMMGLAVDLGWSYFVKRSAQSAADAAAQAAVQQALDKVGQNGTFDCSGHTDYVPGRRAVQLQRQPDHRLPLCPTARIHGGWQQRHQNVTIAADITSPVPTAPGVANVDYWVTVRASESIPQLFSAVLGNTIGTSAARATAAVLYTPLPEQIMPSTARMTPLRVQRRARRATTFPYRVAVGSSPTAR